MRELTDIERYVYNPAFAAFGFLVIWAGVRLIRSQMERDAEGSHFVLNLQSVRGLGLTLAGAFLAGVAIVMTILGHTLLPS